MATRFRVSDDDPESLANGLAEVVEHLLYNGRVGLTAEAAAELIRLYGPAAFSAARQGEAAMLLQEWNRNVEGVAERLQLLDRYLRPYERETAYLTARDVRLITQICPKKPKL